MRSGRNQGTLPQMEFSQHITILTLTLTSQDKKDSYFVFGQTNVLALSDAAEKAPTSTVGLLYSDSAMNVVVGLHPDKDTIIVVGSAYLVARAGGNIVMAPDEDRARALTILEEVRHCFCHKCRAHGRFSWETCCPV